MTASVSDSDLASVKPTGSNYDVTTSLILMREGQLSPQKVSSHLIPDIIFSNYPLGSDLILRQITFKGEILEFPAIALPEDLDPAKIASYKNSLKLLEEESLPAVLLQGAPRETIDNTLKTICQRLYALLEAWGEVAAERKSHKDMTPVVRQCYKDLALIEMLTNMHLDPTFKPSTNFSGNFGWNFLSMKKVVEEGNPRERMFLLLNVVRNLLQPQMKKLKETGELAGFMIELNKKLQTQDNTWSVPEDFQIVKGPYFEFAKAVRQRGAKKPPPNPTIAELISKTSEAALQKLIPLSGREEGFALYRANDTAEKQRQNPENNPLFWGAASSRCATLAEMPGNPYLAAANDSHLPLLGSPSGVAADFGTLPFMLGLKDESIKYGLRLACLAALLAEKNHSAIEILTAARSWGLPCINAPDYYLNLLPEKDSLNQELVTSLKQVHQQTSGDARLPHEYLIS